MTRFWQRITDWEQWPFGLIYAPLIFLWIYYSIRAGSIWFFSSVNPDLEFSGFEGEGKREMYTIMPEHYYPATFYVLPTATEEALLTQLKNSGIKFPLVVKPDRGMQGILFRIIDNLEQLLAYHDHVPVEYIVQEFVTLPVEVSVFHVRYPDQQSGELTGFILKEYLSVTGNGASELMELIMQHPKASLRLQELAKKHRSTIHKIIPKGEKYYLSYAGNHNQGARFINLYTGIDEQLKQVIDDISKECKTFYYGRYDLKCTSIDDLKAGKNFSILEYNGAGAEPNHIYDCGLSYVGALKEIARHWKFMFEIGRINVKRGIPYWSFLRGARYLINARKFFSMLRQFDLEAYHIT